MSHTYRDHFQCECYIRWSNRKLTLVRSLFILGCIKHVQFDSPPPSHTPYTRACVHASTRTRARRHCGVGVVVQRPFAKDYCLWRLGDVGFCWRHDGHRLSNHHSEALCVALDLRHSIIGCRCCMYVQSLHLSVLFLFFFF